MHCYLSRLSFYGKNFNLVTSFFTLRFASKMNKRLQPYWSPSIQKQSEKLPELKFFNSLTLSKEKFVPRNGIDVTWYTCGPTVYDISHMGHARTYIAFDVLRRILGDYFGFNIKYVLNITDVDDKIIKRARQNYLLEVYRKRDLDLAAIITDISEGIKRLKVKAETDPEPEKRVYFKNEVERLILLLTSQCKSGDPLVYLINNARDTIADVLDAKDGHSVTDNKIFEVLSRRFEAEYHEDMKALNILAPDVLVRVTEYIEPIINFVQKIIDNGFAYVAASGSVYFDTNRFASEKNHFYAKLVPNAFGDSDQLAVGEGELSTTTTGEKRSFNDFALWKASKSGEPAWPSPWGNGRPGWHIECSAMASGILGDTLDIHGGGVDLKFPHHDNELAQSEAYFGHSHWVNYFLHSGHLTISGCKMSKSLKNFVTIRDALRTHSARQIRLTFLLHSWRDPMDFGPDTLAEALSFEKHLIDFLYNCTNFLFITKECTSSNRTDAMMKESEHVTLKSLLDKAKIDVYNALCDSCDTRAVLEVIKDLTSQADLRISDPNLPLPTDQTADAIYSIASFVLRILRIFGLADPSVASIGSPVAGGQMIAGAIAPLELDTAGQRTDWLSMDCVSQERLGLALNLSLQSTASFVNVLLSEGNMFQEHAKTFVSGLRTQFGIDLFDLPLKHETILRSLYLSQTSNMDYSQVLTTDYGLETYVWPVAFRCFHYLVSIRQTVRSHLTVNNEIDKASKQRLYKACDEFRDVGLANAGVRLQDRANASRINQGLDVLPYIGLIDSKIILQELKNKEDRDHQTPKPRVNQSATQDELGQLAPSKMFIHQLDKYSKFDEKGVPTHDHLGKELSKSALKKLKKLYDSQVKRHATYLNKKHE